MSSSEVTIPRGPERQRVLNVLAQRRYRQRKRERLQALEKKLETSMRDANAMSTPREESQLQDGTQPPFPRPGNLGTPPNDALFGFYPDSITRASDVLSMYPVSYDSACDTSDLSLFARDQIVDNAFLPYYNTPQSISSPSESQLSAELQDLQTSQFTFPSDRAIEIPTLRSMEVSLRIAHMLGLVDEFLDLNLRRVVDVSKIPIPLEDLPANLRPTEAQVLIPHYPVIDVLPWPSVRTKLICLFHQPDQLRPPIARGPMAIMGLMLGIDDEAEGMRIALDTDGNGYDGKTWEVGQAIFKDWWWVLDPDIVSNSNRLRRKRGAPALKI